MARVQANTTSHFVPTRMARWSRSGPPHTEASEASGRAASIASPDGLEDRAQRRARTRAAGDAARPPRGRGSARTRSALAGLRGRPRRAGEPPEPASIAAATAWAVARRALAATRAPPGGGAIPPLGELSDDPCRRRPALDLAPGGGGERDHGRVARGARLRSRPARGDRRASPRAPAAGPCRPRLGQPDGLGKLLVRDGPSRRSVRARAVDLDLDDGVGPIEPDGDPVRVRREVRAERFVDDPEQAALEVDLDPRSAPIESNSTGTPRAAPRSRARDASVGTRPRSSRTIGRTSKMNDFVASRVCWTIWTSSRSSPRAPSGSRPRRRSTIWAWRTMFVRLWAGRRASPGRSRGGGPPGR
jgi:hypothetical protein